MLSATRRFSFDPEIKTGGQLARFVAATIRVLLEGLSGNVLTLIGSPRRI